MDNQKELFPIVDEDGVVLGSISRGEAHDGTKVLHPVVHLHLFNSLGELYLQKRPEWKDIQPGKWDTSMGGHIDFGEEVSDALHREAREELGITNFKEEYLGKYIFEGMRERELVYVYKTTYDGEVHPNPEELAGGKFFKKEDIIKMIGKSFFTPNFEDEYVETFLK